MVCPLGAGADRRRRGPAGPRRPRPARRPATPGRLFAFAAVVSGGLLIALNSQLTFFIDDWEVLLHRRGFSVDAFFSDHAGHPSMRLVAVYKAIQATFGMGSLTPYAVVSTLVFFTSVILLFIWMRRRVGDWLALAAALPLLFLGAAYEDLLSPFQLGYFAPIACGIGALLALEGGDRRGDVICCALLVLAISFQTVGLIFVAAARSRSPGIGSCARASGSSCSRLPSTRSGISAGADSDASQLSFENLATAPGFILDGYASRSRRCSGSPPRAPTPR